ncbi:RNase H family protein [Mycolicibacterium mengxianglii]|uniref:RNase H family protein n=1 Tax=Mycolicibacterium mengxianglii TaxID=2736649 RepID=UPI0027DA310B|nr:RNase H family protein [Mycolicibacterium mengxianglii]
MVTLHGESRFHAVDGHHSWTGRFDAPNRETAILDAITQIRTESSGLNRVRVLVNLDATSHLWAHASEIAALLPGVTIEAPSLADQPLMSAAAAGLAADVLPAPAEDGPPIVVATDGSVRGRFTGYGWVASTGDFGLRGFPHAAWQVGGSAVLIAELRAINDAVRTLPRRHLTVLTDSRPAIAMLQKWMVGDDVLPAGYTSERRSGVAGLVEVRERIRLQQRRIDLRWVPGHSGELLNEGADALARLASRYAKGETGLSRAEYRQRAAGVAEAFSQAFQEAS